MSYCASQLSQVRKRIVVVPMIIYAPSLTSWCNIHKPSVTYSARSTSPSRRVRKLHSLGILNNPTPAHYSKLLTLATYQTASWRVHPLKTANPFNQYPYLQIVPLKT